MDFKKAFDSVDRKKMIKALMKQNIHPKIISLIVKIYNEDSTLFQNGEQQTTINITNGIRQGCNASTLLFTILSYEIINSLERRNIGFNSECFKIPVIFYADDTLLLSHSIEKPKRVSYSFEKQQNNMDY